MRHFTGTTGMVTLSAVCSPSYRGGRGALEGGARAQLLPLCRVMLGTEVISAFPSSSHRAGNETLGRAEHFSESPPSEDLVASQFLFLLGGSLCFEAVLGALQRPVPRKQFWNSVLQMTVGLLLCLSSQLLGKWRTVCWPACWSLPFPGFQLPTMTQ